MAAANCLLTEDQFRCSICLDVFTDPVTIPCGHNFCKTCISEHWNIDVQCPICKKVFNTRPELQVNTFISEMAAWFRQSAQQKASSSSSEQQAAKPGEVPCDLNDALLDEDDQMCVAHDAVPMTEEYLEAEIQQMIQKRLLKIQEVKHSVELSKEDADSEIADGVQVFTALKKYVVRSKAELIKTIKEEQRETEKHAEGFIKELEQEISELTKRSTEVGQLSHSENRLLLIKELEQKISELKRRSIEVGQLSQSEDYLPHFNFFLLNAAFIHQSWPKFNVHPPSHVGTVRRAVNQLGEKLDEVMKYLISAELKRIKQYAVDVTLDPDTAHPKLVLSDDGKQVHNSDVEKNLPDNPERFVNCVSVLAKQSFSSGRFYYETQVKGKTEWSLGVARKSINRKGIMMSSPQRSHWTIWFRNDDEEYKAFAGSHRLYLKSQPQKVGVFVDYEEGLVSFYDVNAAALIYSFTCPFFNDNIYPFFLPGFNHDGRNSAPLIISPVYHTE